MVAVVVCLASLALVALAYKVGYRRALRRVNRQVCEVAEGLRLMAVEREATQAQRHIVEMGLEKYRELWEQTARAAAPRSGTQYDARAARAARDAARVRAAVWR